LEIGAGGEDQSVMGCSRPPHPINFTHSKTGRTFEMRSKSIILAQGSTSAWNTVPAGSPQPRITKDLLGPTVTIPVSSTTGLSVGDWIILRSDATDAFIAEHNASDGWGGIAARLGGVMFQRQIVNIDSTASALIIDIPIRYYLKTRDNARVYKTVPHLEEIGLENFSIGNIQHPKANAAASTMEWGRDEYNTVGKGAYDVSHSYAIKFSNIRNSWISSISSFRPIDNTLDTHILSNGIRLERTRSITIRKCEFQRPLYGGGDGNGYMYELRSSNDCLVRDCIARYARHGFVITTMQSSGNVYHGGLTQDTAKQVADFTWTLGEGSDHHLHLSQSNLIDGVQVERDFFDAYFRGFSGVDHGQTAVHSVFWNLVGLEYQANKRFIVRSEQARYGYIVGTRGAATGATIQTATPLTRTAPIDHLEGVGTGEGLSPLSLYHDQLTRRLQKELPPPAPTAVSAVGGTTSVALKWLPSQSATGYQIRKSQSPYGPYSLISTVTSAAFIDSDASSVAANYYNVSAINSTGESVASQTIGSRLQPAYRQNVGSEGLLIFEAEQYDNVAQQGGVAWERIAAAGASGGIAMAALPNTGIARDTLFTANSPRLDYRTEFLQAGLYYVWIRGQGASGNDDSVHVGLNGVASETADKINGFPSTFTWWTRTSDGPVATLSVPSPGIHVLNIWMREDGVVIDKVLLTTSASFTPTGTGPAPSDRIEAIKNGATSTAPTLVNLSTRAQVGGYAGTPVCGFVIGGSSTKRLLIRAVGPTLGIFGVSNFLRNPTVSVVGQSSTLEANDDWLSTDATVFASVGAFPLPVGSQDAALVTSLRQGAYTTPVGNSGSTGVVLLEIYDSEPSITGSTVLNASTRAYVGRGDEVLIPGFTLAGGTGSTRVLIRAIGPTLASFGVDDVLSDPHLTLFSSDKTIGGNDNWSASGNADELIAVSAQVGAFSLAKGSRDAALLVALPKGSYTVSISGVNGGVGTAIFELYIIK